MSVRFQHYDRLDIPDNMKKVSLPYETKFGIDFCSLTYFSQEVLTELHAEGNKSELDNFVTVASSSDGGIMREIDTLTNIANTPNISVLHRAQYRTALETVYGRLPNQPGPILNTGGVLCVGIEREGRILAEAMGWMAYPDSIHPDAKRIPFKQGLLVGVSDIPSLARYEKCVIIDGAIASGATLVAVMAELSKVTMSFHIFSVHATVEGLRAIVRCASDANASVHITVGHMTPGINDHFYAVDPKDPLRTRVMVGDLGDTIS